MSLSIVERLLTKVNLLYVERDEPTGGMLHVQLDDGNLADGDLDDPFPDWMIELHGREPYTIEREIVALLKQLTIEEREELYDDDWWRGATRRRA